MRSHITWCSTSALVSPGADSLEPMLPMLPLLGAVIRTAASDARLGSRLAREWLDLVLPLHLLLALDLPPHDCYARDNPPWTQELLELVGGGVPLETALGCLGVSKHALEVRYQRSRAFRALVKQALGGPPFRPR